MSTVNDARAALENFGIASDWQEGPVDSGVDYVATLRKGHYEQTYAVMIRSRPTLTVVAAIDRDEMNFPVLVLGTHINERNATAFRDARVQYVDAVGNAYLSFGDVYVDVRGRRRPKTIEAAEGLTARTETNLFSARRAQVICMVLASPSLANARVVDVAEAAGVSVGLAHDALVQLQRAGFTGAAGLRRTGELIDLWAAAYPAGLGATLALDRFVGEPSPERVMGTDIWTVPALSGEAAVSDLMGRQLTLTVYVDELDPGLAVVNRWRRDPARIPNVYVRRRFWQGGFAETWRADQPVAPWPIVYADLLASGEPRLVEVSKHWRSRHGA